MPDLGEIAYNAYLEKWSPPETAVRTWAEVERDYPDTARAWSAAAEAVVAELHRLEG